MNKILIGGAWPYANGSLHIGHIAGLLPGDILARYWRLQGADVFYVSGSDCHGTPISIRAQEEGRTPQEISEFYHKEFKTVFKKLHFSYDLYTKTSDIQHKEYVKQFHRQLYKSPYIKEQTTKQAYCPKCRKILTDRFITGTCPKCGELTKGDQCDACGEVLEADTMIEPRCSICNTLCDFTDSTQIFLLLSHLKEELTALLESHPNWRKNAIAFTKKYIDEGLRDRAITRDLDWGIDVPKKGYEEKKIYIWAENVLGYLSASMILCKKRNVAFDELFGEHARHYYVHGKDNIPFHTIILPSLLLAHGGGFHLPDDIISSEYVTLEGKKISTSRNHAIWAKDLVDKYNPDAIRYFFIANGPEKRDADFSWHEFVERNNTELAGIWGNFVNRTFVFIIKYLKGVVPGGELHDTIKQKIESSFDEIGRKIEKGNFKNALRLCFDLIRFGNKYYDQTAPWNTRLSQPEECANSLYNCIQLIANISVLLEPLLPASSTKIHNWLKIPALWKPVLIPEGQKIPEIEILFEKIDLRNCQ